MKLLDQELIQMLSIDRKVFKAIALLHFRNDGIKYSEVQDNTFFLVSL